MKNKNIIEIYPSIARGDYYPPPSKSLSIRAILAASLADGPCNLYPIDLSDDVSAILEIIKNLSANYSLSGKRLHILGPWASKKNSAFDFSSSDKTSLHFDCNESASCLRLMIPQVWLRGQTSYIYADRKLLKRPLDPYQEIAKEKAFEWIQDEDYLKTRGQLKADLYRIRADVSSQFISGLLFALPLLDGDSRIELIGESVSRPYIGLSLKVLSYFGLVIEEEKNSFYIPGRQEYRSADYTIEGDYSSAAYFLALEKLGHPIKIHGLNKESLQADKTVIEYLDRLGNSFATISLKDCPDLGPVLFSYAALKHGGLFTDTDRLRDKESDRIASMQEEMAKMGLIIEPGPNRVLVKTGKLKSPDRPLYSHNDHRVAMALSLIMIKSGGILYGADSVKKSYPTFFDDLRSLAVNISY